MTASSAERVIAASPEAVFARLTDQTAWHTWLPGHGGWLDGMPPSVAVGITFSQRMGFFGIYDTVSVTVNENRAPMAFGVVAKGNLGASARLAFRLSPADHGSTVVNAEAEVFGNPVRPVAALAQRVLTKAVRSGLSDFQAHVEAGVATPQPEGNDRVLLQ